MTSPAVKVVCALVLVSSMLTSTSTTAVVSAQVSSYSMIINCPQGCRPVDKLVSCGGEDKTTACVMHDNGDVMINCTSGRYYSLGVWGCGGDAALDPNPALPASIFGSGVAKYVAEHQANAQVRTIAFFQGISATTLALILFGLAGIHGIFGFSHLTFLQIIPSTMLGVTFGYLAVSFFVPTDLVLHQWVALTSGIGLGLILCIFALKKKSSIRAMMGANFGLFAGLVFLYAHQQKFPDFNLGGITMPFFIVISAMVMFSSVGACIPFALGVFMFASESAVFAAWGFGVWTHSKVGGNPDPLTNVEDSGFALALFFGVFLVVLIIQSCLARRMVLKNKQLKLRMQLMADTADGFNGDPFVLAQRREAERKKERKREKKREKKESRNRDQDGSPISPMSGNLLQDGNGGYGTSSSPTTPS